MSERSSIEWTDSTWNPVTGCTKVSPGCRNCYAQTFAERFRGVAGHPYEQGFDLKLWPDRVELPLRWRKPRMVFVNSMSDLFHEDVPDRFIRSVFRTMRLVDRHTFQVLTKRSERMREFVLSRARSGEPLDRIQPNTWIGTSIETQDYLGRAEALIGLPAAVRFLSCEPLLGPLDLTDVLSRPEGIDWVIVGGESGPRCRPVDPDWVRSIRDQCLRAHVPFFFKQWGGTSPRLRGSRAGTRSCESRSGYRRVPNSHWLEAGHSKSPAAGRSHLE